MSVPSIAVALAALRSGAPLGEGWLYGRSAVDLLLAGAREEEFEAHRSGLFFEMRKIWGQDAALERERELLARHAIARATAGLPAYSRVAGRSWQARNPAEVEEEVR